MERDAPYLTSCRCNHEISTHTLTWSVTCIMTCLEREKVISTHTLTWSVTIFNFDCAFVILHFNSHAHVERDLSGILAHIFSRYFNSHAHVERDMIIWQHFRNMRISTHTLTWSVTNDTLYKYLPCFISTHTLTWSVTNGLCVLYIMILHFNSHAHVERDDTQRLAVA